MTVARVLASLVLALSCAGVAVPAPNVTDSARAVSQLAPGGVAACIGVPGTGKTTVAARASESWRRVVVFDPYSGRDAVNDAAGVGSRRSWEGERRTVADLVRKPALLDRLPLRLVVGSADPFDSGAMAREFSVLSRLLWHTGGVVLVAEECGRYSREAADAVLATASGGAHAELALVLVCQSIGRIAIHGREAVTLISAGAQGEPRDLHHLRERCGKDFAGRVARLRAPSPGVAADAPIVWRLGDGVV